MKNDIKQGLNQVDIKTILSWYPGDYMYECECPEEQYYHTCKSIDTQWQHVLDVVRYDERYYDIMDSVQSFGVTVPLRAKFTANNNCVLVDGHNRIGACVDLSIKQIPVFVASLQTDVYDLVAPDSHWWTAGQIPWPLDH